MFTSLGNNLRFFIFEKKAEQLMREGKTFENSTQEYKDVARVINEMTGRGKAVPIVEQATPYITPVIWSPKLMASSFNLLGIGDLAGKGYYRSLTPAQRKFALEQTVTGISVGIGIMSAAAFAGADVDYDPRSVTFGNISFGDKSYNVFGRFASYVKLVAQQLTGTRVKGGSEDDLTDNKGKTKGDIGLGFLRGKMTPFSGMVTDYLMNDQKNYFNYEKMTPTSMAQSMFIPMSAQDIVKGLKRDGAASLLTGFIPSFVGIKVSDARDFEKGGKSGGAGASSRNTDRGDGRDSDRKNERK